MYADDDDDAFGFGGFAAGPFGAHQGFRMRQRQFSKYYSAYPVAAYPGNKADANYGGKIFMPPSALEELSRLEIVYPMLFKLENDEASASKRTHCGVLEFTAEEGRVYLPQWMMETLELAPGSPVKVLNVALLHGSLVKLQPQSTDFLDISDHRAVLENALRKFSALTVGDIITIEYNSREYRIAVLETKPSPTAINIVETDLSVDFAAPLGYVEPNVRTASGASNHSSAAMDAASRPSSSIAKDIRRKEEAAKGEIANSRFAAFRGSGFRLNKDSGGGAAATAPPRSYASTPDSINHPSSAATKDAELESEQPVPLDLPVGTLFFGYDLVPPPGSEPDNNASADEAKADRFQGKGQVLRQRRKR
ncbi:ubiquitin fusion degradation protein [Coemansia thaxteri]|uniref:Ubiquitin fusion degradation protein n=1 Tax=Coemansia thaxteri TaxID=2663907 RepID=A0A9W8BJW0_9FUNG|nr:ubiquitin fusion degradation protein [Coemansia thaxteri]KAJ2007544.1 ubiquitin fusion degradation protein [Coemansia thaxteri]KAJ2472465.1 ubiquitin fusion degradation protein [Coemansia sp. RSA 2322]KAJ2484614.1 ubiquitin fusion degradation protein [Coemansia sp. RSA 2320]